MGRAKIAVMKMQWTARRKLTGINRQDQRDPPEAEQPLEENLVEHLTRPFIALLYEDWPPGDCLTSAALLVHKDGKGDKYGGCRPVWHPLR